MTHLFFVDDSYIFCKANKDSADQVMEMLNAIEKASGQKINVNKSSAFFSYNTEATIRAEICGILNFNEADGNTQYLGLQDTLGRNKSSILG